MRLLTITFLAFTATAYAEPMRQISCTNLIESINRSPLFSFDNIDITRSSVRDGACVYSGVKLGSGGSGPVQYTADEIIFRGTELDTTLLDPGANVLNLPTDMLFEVKRLRIGISTSEPVFDFLNQAQTKRDWIDISFGASWDQSASTYSIHTARASFSNGDYLSLTARFREVQLAEGLEFEKAAMKIRLDRVTLEMRNLAGAAFEGMLLGPIVSSLPMDVEGPDAVGAFLRQLLTSNLGKFPEAAFEGDARAALSSFVSDLPNPNGLLVIKASFEGGLGVAEAMGMGFIFSSDGGSGAAVFEKFNIEASYDRTPLNK